MSNMRLYVVGGMAVLSGVVIAWNYFFPTPLWLFILAIAVFCICAPWTYYLRAKARSSSLLSDDEILRNAKLEEQIREVKNGKK
jgi:membrane protein implicated in regulation of membrane protease activity